MRLEKVVKVTARLISLSSIVAGLTLFAIGFFAENRKRMGAGFLFLALAHLTAPKREPNVVLIGRPPPFS